MRHLDRRSRARPGALAGLGGLAVLVVLVVLSACGGEAKRAVEQQATRAAIETAESTATRVAAQPATGLWSEATVLERLVRAGVAPRPVEDAPDGPDWMRVRPAVFAAGGGEVHAWVYVDSTARRAVTDALDPATGAPPGRVPPFASPMIFVMQNNLAAIISGGSETNQERIALALQGGLPAAPPP